MWDYCAYKGLISNDDEVRKLISNAIVAKNRKNQQGFFNNLVQKELANRPKSSYYLKDNPDKAKEYAYLGGVASGKIWTEKKIEKFKWKICCIWTTWWY